MSAFAYHRPRTIPDALRLVSESPGARFIAGGTDLMVKINAGAMHPETLVSLRNIPALSGIDLGEQTIIGALATIADMLRNLELCERYPLLAQAARTLGGPQIRNVATIGGNLCNCSPCADTAPALLALEARIRLLSPAGEREIALEDFMSGPGQTCSAPDEILTHVLLPKAPRGAAGIYFKNGPGHRLAGCAARQRWRQTEPCPPGGGLGGPGLFAIARGRGSHHRPAPYSRSARSGRARGNGCRDTH